MRGRSLFFSINKLKTVFVSLSPSYIYRSINSCFRSFFFSCLHLYDCFFLSLLGLGERRSERLSERLSSSSWLDCSEDYEEDLSDFLFLHKHGKEEWSCLKGMQLIAVFTYPSRSSWRFCPSSFCPSSSTCPSCLSLYPLPFSPSSLYSQELSPLEVGPYFPS